MLLTNSYVSAHTAHIPNSFYLAQLSIFKHSLMFFVITYFEQNVTPSDTKSPLHHQRFVHSFSLIHVPPMFSYPMSKIVPTGQIHPTLAGKKLISLSHFKALIQHLLSLSK